MAAGPYTSHPFPIRALNAMGPMLRRINVVPRLEVDSLIKSAKRKTGLTDFGDDWFLGALEVLVQSINEEARLSALGQFIMHKRLLDALCTRLRAETLFIQHPEITDINLGHVFVIAGLQRTGTTLLHRMMASNPKIRAPLSWEALNPVPLPRDERNEQRIKQAKTAERALKYIAPTFFAIHPVEYDMPEEDVLMLDLSFMSQSSEATMWVPSYANWLEQADSTNAYLYLKRMMQLLHWQQPADHTVLKSPHHMEYIDIILKVFPNASIVQTHRDPQKTMASFISMVCHGAGVFSDYVDVPALSRHWQRKVRRLIDLSVAVREKQGADAFIDVAYQDLVTEPTATLKGVYSHGGVSFDEAAERHVQVLLKRQVKNKYGRHAYDMADFGLSRDAIEQQFGDYRARYAIPFEGAE